MTRRVKMLLIGVAVATAAIAPAIAWAGSGDDAGEVDTPITGPALQQASDAAIAHLGGGTVTETEVGDEDSFYEVEVTLDDGRQVDVQLDEGFNVVGTENDGFGDDD